MAAGLVDAADNAPAGSVVIETRIAIDVARHVLGADFPSLGRIDPP
jgi:hypothetical protein